MQDSIFIEKVSREYGLISPKVVRRFKGGYQNLTYLLRADGLYVLKLYVGTPRVSLLRVRRVLEVLKALEGCHLPLPVVRVSKDGKLFVPLEDLEWQGKKVVGLALFEYLPGTVLDWSEIGREEIRKVARIIGKLHLCLRRLSNRVQVGEGLEKPPVWRKRLEKLNADLNDRLARDYLSLGKEKVHGYLHVWQKIFPRLLLLEKEYNLPYNQLIHTDLTRQNILFSSSRSFISGVLDFDALRWGNAWEELGIAVAAWFDHQKRRLSLGQVRKIFLDAYQQEFPLNSFNSDKEHTLLALLAAYFAWEKVNHFVQRPQDQYQRNLHYYWLESFTPSLEAISAQVHLV